jgi:pimeloyl-ACP methyl ester carboxylesterase
VGRMTPHMGEMTARVSFSPVAFVQAHGLTLHFQAWGPSEVNAGVVLVHGLGSSCHIWDFVGPLVAQDMLRVVALDQRGHGETDQPDTGYDFPSVVADLTGFMDGIGLTQRSVLVGHSWGASVVLHFAVAHPERAAAIALVDGGTSSPGERWSWAETETRLRPPELDGMPWTDLRQRMSRNNGAYAESRAEALERSLFDLDAHGRVRRKFRIPHHMQVVRALWEQRPTELLARLECPVLLLPARQSTDSSDMSSAKAAAIARALDVQPRARVRWFENSVHDVPLQRPEELASELSVFVRQVLQAPTPS